MGLLAPVHVTQAEYIRGIRMSLYNSPDATVLKLPITVPTIKGHWFASVIYPIAIGYDRNPLYALAVVVLRGAAYHTELSASHICLD